MADHRIIYVSPGDVIEVRVIRDPDEPRTAAAWKDQLAVARGHARAMSLKVMDHEYLEIQTPTAHVTHRKS